MNNKDTKKIEMHFTQSRQAAKKREPGGANICGEEMPSLEAMASLTGIVYLHPMN